MIDSVAIFDDFFLMGLELALVIGQHIDYRMLEFFFLFKEKRKQSPKKATTTTTKNHFMLPNDI